MGCVVLSGGGERFTARCVAGAGLKPPCLIVLVDAGARGVLVARRLADACGCRLLEYHTGGRVDPALAGGIAGELADCKTVRACVSGGGLGVLHVLSALGLTQAYSDGVDVTLCWETRRVEHCIPFKLIHPPVVSKGMLETLLLLREAGGRVERKRIVELVKSRLGYKTVYAYTLVKNLAGEGLVKLEDGFVEATELGVALGELETRLHERRGSLGRAERE